MKWLSAELALATEAARTIGRHQLSCFQGDFRVLRKDAREFVSSVDLKCHELALQLLSTAAPVVSEEVRGNFELDEDRYWVVDPLDGSHNYISGLPHFGVSIALVDAGQIVLGVIGLPFFNELFYAVKGEGAFLDGARIQVSDNRALSKAMVTYDNQFHLQAQSLARYRRLINCAFTTRVLGSAIYDLSLLSRGHVDARVFNHTKVYDFAAGVVLVREAGGRVTDFSGAEVGVTNRQIVASNGGIHSELLAALEGAKL